MKELDRVRWRCRRGMLELDIVLQRFVDKHYAQLNENELQQFDTLLNLPDNDLWDMITAKKEVGDVELQPMLQLLQIE
ncbi:MAG: succinate dehydrogenase assembly factor 2 [Nitrosomonadaceae bacterium]